jgi:hypothetical protein
MTPRRFAALLEAYGTDLSRWPPGERAAGRDFAATPAAAPLLAAARPAEVAIAATAPRLSPEAAARLRRAIAGRVARLPAPARRDPFGAWLGRLAPAGIGALAVLVAGGAWIALSPPAEEGVMFLVPLALPILGTVL